MVKRMILFLLCFLIPANALASGGEYECIVDTDCKFLWVAINNADHVGRYTAAIAADGAADINLGWYYDDDDTLSDISDANEVDEVINCSSEVPASGMCLEIISAARGIYVIYVDSLLITESGKEFCIDVDDAYTTTKVDDAVLCKYVAVEDRVIVADNIGINLNDITQATGPTTLTNITVPTVTTTATATTVTSGVTVTTNNDKTGYTASTVSDKTGYSLAADAITAATIADDAGNEIAGQVWGEDATANQTQGTFGQAIGDPVADADTIWGLSNTNLDATVSSRMATYTQPTGFLATTFPTGTVANTTNITAGTIASVTNDVGITQAGADKVWGTTARTITGGTISTYTGNTPQTGDSFARLGAPAGASVSADVAAIQSDTNDIQGRLPTALVGGKMDSSVGAMATGVVTSDAVASGAIGASESGEYTFTVVSSADCTNSAVLFDTNLTQTQTDHWKDSFATFTSGTLAGQTKAVTAFNGTTRCMTVKSPGFSTTPTSGDTGIIVNK